MNIVVVVASKHGSTLGIAGALAQRLTADGAHVTVSDPATAPDLEDADAVIIGSAIYMGKWLKEARRFIDEQQQALSTRPVWLFSSGPLGEAETGIDTDAMDEDHLAEITERAHAFQHHVFAGKLDRAQLNPLESLVAAATHTPTGDFRDWDAIDHWADEIIETLGEITDAQRS